jgi:aryl-alcohol dehydrogenase-like predicted oxidoreductase
MKVRNLGKSDLRVSVIGLGCNNFGMFCDLEESRAVIDVALDSGITLFDTADIYGKQGGSETILGKVLGPRRKNIILATKFGKPMDDSGTMKGASRRYILDAVEASLNRLKTDWIDLYQIHESDPNTPMDETLTALDDLIRQGKVRYVGCSNFPAWKVVESCWVTHELDINGFVSCQDHYSLIARGIEHELIPAMESYDLGLLPFFPLAGGLLTGKYKRNKAAEKGTRFAAWKDLAQRYTTQENWNLIQNLEAFCAERAHNLLELAFGWLLAKPIVSSVIAGATRPEQIKRNISATGWILSDEDLAEIDRLNANSRTG